jgi:hypothetical protein
MQPGAPHTKQASAPASVATPFTSSLSTPNPDKDPAVAAEDFRENRLSIEGAIFRFYSNNCERIQGKKIRPGQAKLVSLKHCNFKI